MLLRSSDIVKVSDMTGIIEFAGIWKKQGRVFASAVLSCIPDVCKRGTDDPFEA